MPKATNTSFLKQVYFTIFKISYFRFVKSPFFRWVKNVALKFISCLFFPLHHFIDDEFCCEHCLGFHRAGRRDVFTWKLILINSVIILLFAFQLHKYLFKLFVWVVSNVEVFEHLSGDLCRSASNARKLQFKEQHYVTVLLFNLEHIVGDRISNREMKVWTGQICFG